MKAIGVAHIFSGKGFCLECRNYMREKKSSKHEYLVCSGNRNVYNNCINKASIRYYLLSDLVLDSINKKIKEFYDEEDF